MKPRTSQRGGTGWDNSSGKPRKRRALGERTPAVPVPNAASSPLARPSTTGAGESDAARHWESPLVASKRTSHLSWNASTTRDVAESQRKSRSATASIRVSRWLMGVSVWAICKRPADKAAPDLALYWPGISSTDRFEPFRKPCQKALTLIDNVATDLEAILWSLTDTVQVRGRSGIDDASGKPGQRCPWKH